MEYWSIGVLRYLRIAPPRRRGSGYARKARLKACIRNAIVRLPLLELLFRPALDFPVPGATLPILFRTRSSTG